MIALYDFEPKFCPNCGAESPLPLQTKNEEVCRAMRHDFHVYCSFRCRKCGVHYQKVQTEYALVAADSSGGDLRFYVEKGD